MYSVLLFFWGIIKGIFRFFYKIIVQSIATFIALCLVFIIGISFFIGFFAEDKEIKPKTLPEDMVLVLDFNESYFEDPAQKTWERLLQQQPQMLFHELITTIKNAAHDPNVKGLIGIGEGYYFNTAQAEELARAILYFKEQEKFTKLYATTFAEGGGGIVGYYVASHFDYLAMQPSGHVGLHGLALESPFLKQAFDKWGIQAEFITKHEYKGLADMFLYEQFSEPVKESLTMLLDDIHNTLMDQMAENRRLSRKILETTMSYLPLTAQKEQEYGLIDTLIYKQEFLDYVEYDLIPNKQLNYIDISEYYQVLTPKLLKEKKHQNEIGLIYASGEIIFGENTTDIFQDSALIYSDDFIALLDEAYSKNLKAIVIRLDTPGGSYVGSDSIWYKIQELRQNGIPVVISMGETCASGGYFIASAADHILAEKTTITGSIGVASGKFVVKQLSSNLGISWDTIETGENSTIYSPLKPFTETQKENIHTSMNAAYRDFTTKVATGRGLNAAQIDQVARGRVWSGLQAKELGLVDSYGGIGEAVEEAKRLAGIKDDVTLVILPETAPFFELLINYFGQLSHSALQTFITLPLKQYQLEHVRQMYQTLSREPILLYNPIMLKYQH